MLPIRDSNSFTDAFARREILDRVAPPVFFGAAACDPRLTVEALLTRIRDAGYQGVANFPTAIHRTGDSAARLSGPASASGGRGRFRAPRPASAWRRSGTPRPAPRWTP